MAGDEEAFSLLYRRWHPRLLRHAGRITPNSEDACDVMQEAAVAMARNIHRLENPESFGPWVYTIVRNRALNHIKRKKRDHTLKEAFKSEPCHNSTPVVEDNRADLLRDLIRTLTASDQEILIAYYVDGMSVVEISECLAAPAGTIKSRLHGARARLKLAYQSRQGNDNE